MSSAVHNALDAYDRGEGALTLARLESLFSFLSAYTRVLVGVSGGPDSLALLHLLADWKAGTSNAIDLHIVTVDHGLRAEAADEARHVAKVCDQLGMPHQTLVWKGEKPSSNLQAEAREARYRLFAAEMARIGAEALVLAHHLDDQAETFLDRLTRGSGVYGLSAMAAVEANGPEGLLILRPLLSVPKETLIEELKIRGVRWFEDPSNDNPEFKRVRLRRILKLLEDEGLSPRRLHDTAMRLRRARQALDEWCRSILDTHLTIHPAGPVRLPWTALEDKPEEIQLRILAHLILFVTGQTAPGRLAKLETLKSALVACKDVKQTLAGAIVERRDGMVFFWKEAGRSPPPEVPVSDVLQNAEANETSCRWDSRFELSSMGDFPEADEFVIGPLIAAPKAARAIALPADWPPAAFDCAPVFSKDGDTLFVPGLYEAVSHDDIPLKLQLRAQWIW